MLFAKLVAASASLAVVSAAGGHGTEELCACAQADPVHPFTIDCGATGQQAIRNARTTLETSCGAAVQYEWGGIFTTPGTSYKWVAQAAKNTPVTWADPTMKLVIFGNLDAADAAHLQEKADAATTLMAGTCETLTAECTPGDATCLAGTIPASAITSAGKCYLLTFPTVTTKDFIATMDTTGITNMAFFGQHGPTEFELNMHYFMSPDLATDIEPAAQTDAKEYQCRHNIDAVTGVNVCAQAFMIIQSHHDYCPHDTLTRYEEELFHAWEAKCMGCSIKRKYDATLNYCPTIDCLDTTVAALGYNHLLDNCVKADTTYAFEYAGVFPTPLTDYMWVSQAATVGNTWATTAAANYSYADASMKMVACAPADGTKGELHGFKEAADTLMTSGPCTAVTASCTPGDTGCTMPTLTPAAATATGTRGCACIDITFPTQTAVTGLKDFHAKVASGANNHVALFTGHGPTEFERDTHFLLNIPTWGTTDTQVSCPAGGSCDVEASNILGAAVAHDHGRRLGEPYIEKGSIHNEIGSRRRLANPGSCCNNATQQGAWKQVVAYHDICDHSQVPAYIEGGFHDYEASCESYFCNLIGPEVNQTVCPSPPPPPPVLEAASPAATIGVAAGCGAVIVALGLFVYCLVSKEKAGTPMFTTLNPTAGGAASKASAA